MDVAVPPSSRPRLAVLVDAENIPARLADEIFAAVADLGSLSGAARQLGLSAPAVTRAISALEAHVGARLLTRTTRSVTTTEAGARLLLRSREILSLVEAAEREAAGESAVAQGRLTVTASVTFGRLHVAGLLLDFLAESPQVTGSLLLVDRVDEWMLSHLYEFDGKPLQSVAKGGVDLGKLQDEEEKKQAEQTAEAFKPVLERLKISLAERAKDVRTTTRLVDSPACIVVDEHDMSSHLARLLKQAGQDAPKGKPILEVNPAHALLKRLEASEQFDDLAQILFDQALLAEGGQLEDPAAYVQRVNKLLAA